MTTTVRRRLRIYTDGAYTAEKGIGGWAWAVSSSPPGAGREGFGGVRGTTNQRMEMQAALEAILAFQDWPVKIVSDSAYVVNCFQQHWYLSWQRSNWRTTQRKAVANRDLWEPLVDAVLTNNTRFEKVKGHSGDPMNDYVDRLAVQAKKSVLR